MMSRSIQIMLRLSLALALYAALFIFTAPLAQGQEVSADPATTQATTTATQVVNEAQAVNKSSGAAKEAKPAPVPVFKEYRGIEIGMKAADVRSKLNDYLKSKADAEDLFIINGEIATVYYIDGQVTAVSVDYPAKDAKAPTAKDVLGDDVQAKDDGSMYSLVRYPDVGYWVAYSRTSGDSPLVTVTIQKMR